MNTRIGKDVLESLTQSMYEDSRIIYREYIQNSADQIDRALLNGILASRQDGFINIVIDRKEKKILIEDNATGIKVDDIESVLKNIAKSTKDRSKDKGFRGIGRLGGLAYCDELVFETSYLGESQGTKMSWNALKHREIINDRNSHEDAVEVIDAITRIDNYDEDVAKHYFRVILYKVTDEKLLDVDDIIHYLSMVAPVPFKKSQFKYATKIYDYISLSGYAIDEYKVFVNANILEKEYTNYIYAGEEGKKTRCDEILDIDFFEVRSHNKLVLAWGWYSISSFQGVFDEVNTARGIRLRKGNIQIGLENCLEKLHKEKRGNSYFFGEIYAISSELIPNSRRDYFIENSTGSEFNKIVRDYFYSKLYKYYHLASDIRSQFKSIKRTIELKEEFQHKEKNGFKSQTEREDLQLKFDESKKKASKSEEKLRRIASGFDETNNSEKKIFNSVLKKDLSAISDNFGEDNAGVKVIAKTIPNLISDKNNDTKYAPLIVDQIHLTKSNGKATLITDDIKTLNTNQKKVISQVFDIIGKVLPKELADTLIKKITEELKT